MLQWCNVSPPGGLHGTTGLYRVVVEVTGLPAATSDYTSSSLDGWGQHSYSLKLCDTLSPPTAINCGSGQGSNGAGQYNTAPLAIFGWNNMDVTYQETLVTKPPNKNFPQTACVNSKAFPYACLDLGCIPSDYVGRDLTLRVFNLGDSPDNGNVYVSVVPPAGSTAFVDPLPSYMPSSPNIDGNYAARARSQTIPPFRLYTGLWINFQLHIPANYSVDCKSTGTGTGWWQLMFASDQGVQPLDKIGIEFNLTGSPIHLVPPEFT